MYSLCVAPMCTTLAAERREQGKRARRPHAWAPNAHRSFCADSHSIVRIFV